MLIQEDRPFIERKNVILARSGVQIYQASEVRYFGIDERTEDRKDSYRVYRPASVIAGAIDLFKTLPLTKEHPPEFVNGSNYSKYAKGTTGENPELVNLKGGNVGVRSNLVFNTNDIYDYYLNGNKEVSVGYKATYRWNPNYKRDGYDIIMESISVVNHCAVTAAGRGGPSVAIIDSILGGTVSMKSGIFHFLFKNGKSKDSVQPFSTVVFGAISEAKGKDEAEVKKIFGTVMDSINTLVDGDAKDFLASTVTDCFTVMDSAIQNKDKVSQILDSVYAKAEKETLDSVERMTKDEDGKGKGTNNVSDSETDDGLSPEEKEKKDKEAKEKADKEKGGKSTDSAILALIETKFKELDASLTGKVNDSVRTALGLDPKGGSDPKGGTTTDSNADISDVDISKYVL